MINGLQVSDVDIHIVEPPDLWQKYIEPQFTHEAPRTVGGQETGLQGRLMVAGQLVTKEAGPNRMSQDVMRWFTENVNHWYPKLVRMRWSPEAQIVGMDQEGVDTAFLYPSQGLSALANDDITAELALAIAKAYNNWLNDFASYNPRRLKHVTLIPLVNPNGAIKEMRRCALEMNTAGIVVRGEPHQGRMLDDPSYETIWKTAEDLNLAVGLHQATHSPMPTLGATRFNRRFQSHTLSHPLEQMASLVAIIGSGILERHPNLHVALLESGGGWLPYMLWRFDEQYDQLSKIEAPELEMKPSEYFRRQCWISVEPSEPLVQMIAECLGDNVTVISSDFPHGDHPPGGLKIFAARTDIPRKVISRTFWDNTMSLYRT